MTQGGIRAIEKLEEERRERNFEDMSDVNHGRIRKTRKVHAVPKGVASNEMCTLFDIKYFVTAADSCKYDCLRMNYNRTK